jgi:hypothetical protein
MPSLGDPRQAGNVTTTRAQQVGTTPTEAKTCSTHLRADTGDETSMPHCLIRLTHCTWMMFYRRVSRYNAAICLFITSTNRLSEILSILAC